MAGRTSLAGKKYGGRHSSFISGAGKLARFLEKQDSVTKISPGIIKTNLANLQGRGRIKIITERAGLLLRVRDNISMQEMRVYTKDKKKLVQDIETFASKHTVSLVKEK